MEGIVLKVSILGLVKKHFEEIAIFHKFIQSHRFSFGVTVGVTVGSSASNPGTLVDAHYVAPGLH